MSQIGRPPSRWALGTGVVLLLVLVPGGTSATEELPAEDPCPWSTPAPDRAITHSGQAVGTSFMFETPSAWSIDGEFTDDGGGIVVVTPEGAPIASLTVLSGWGAVCGPESACVPQRVVHVEDVPGEEALSGSGDFVVRTVAMDLADRPDLREAFGWEDDVRLVTSLTDGDEPVPETMLPHLMYGLGSIVAGDPAGGDDRSGVVIFSLQREFSTMEEAQAYARSEEHRQLQGVIASFRG